MREAADAIEELSAKYEKALSDLVKQAESKWIPVTERLPEDGQVVLCLWWNIHCVESDNYTVMHFRKGRTAEELKDAKFFRGCDQWGNNKKPYCWDSVHGALSLFGQDVTHWMPLPEPPKEEM